MNKETLSDYGWVIISVMIIGILLAFTSPLGTFYQDAMTESTEIISDQSTQDDGISSRYFDCDDNGVLTIKKAYKNDELIKQIKEVKDAESFQSIEEAVCYVLSDGSQTTLEGLEEYRGNAVDDYLVENYGLKYDDILSLAEGKGTYRLPKNLVIPSVVNDTVVKEIGSNAFEAVVSIEYVAIPSTVTVIGDYAFAQCASLCKVDFGDSIQKIGDGAFLGCSNITSINIPDSITEIGALSFGNCENLLSVKIHKNPDLVICDSEAFSGSVRFSYDEIKWIY